MSRQILMQASSAAGALSAWYIARGRGVEQWYPWIVVGGLAGAVLGELLAGKDESK